MEALERPKACFYRQMRYLPERWGTHFSDSITSSRRRIYFIAQYGGMRVRFARQCRCHR
jgi:hypothetical protein